MVANPNVLRERVSHLWVDTCCIDKTSSAELSEAINSMFRWYQEATCCFALLEDVEANLEADGGVGEDFEGSRWFTRGWTLQELLAPFEVHYFDRNWKRIGSNETLAQRISKRTNIPEDVILTGEWPSATVAQRFSWMAGRETTRPEDLAYCLLGIFDVSMPMLYGEGERALIRLQEEIIRDTDDQSIFAWDVNEAGLGVKGIGVLARHPGQFHDGRHLECLPDRSGPYVLTNKGLQITLPIIELAEKPGEKIALLACSDARDVSSRIGIRVQADDPASAKYTRVAGPPVTIPTRSHDVWQHAMRSIYLAKQDQSGKTRRGSLKWHIRGRTGPLAWFEFIKACPGDSWHVSNAGTMTMLIPKSGKRNGEGSIESSLLFKLADCEATFYLVLAAQTAGRGATVGLVPGPRELPRGEALDSMLEGLRSSDSSVSGSQCARLPVGGGVAVLAKIAPGGGHVLTVILSWE